MLWGGVLALVFIGLIAYVLFWRLGGSGFTLAVHAPPGAGIRQQYSRGRVAADGTLKVAGPFDRQHDG